MATSHGSAISAAKRVKLSPLAANASRLVRLDTGSSNEAVFARWVQAYTCGLGRAPPTSGTQLRQRQADLIVRAGDPAAEIITLATDVQASAVFIADDVSRYATRRRQRLERECARRRLDLALTPGLTVVPPGELTPASGGHYKMFTRTGGPGAPPAGARTVRPPTSSRFPESSTSAGSRRPAPASPQRRWRPPDTRPPSAR